MPRAEYVLAYYQTYFEKTDRRVTFARIEQLAQHILQRTHPTCFEKTVRILDFGGGDGSLAVAMAQQLVKQNPEQHVEIALVDYQVPPSPASGHIELTYASDLEQTYGRYHIVLASAVLEHIPEVYPLLRRLLSLLAPAGYFYARTPWAVPLARLIPGVDLTYPAHVHDLGGVFWNRAATTFGFQGSYLLSGPSPVATRLLADPFRTAAAYLCKFPAQIERLVSPAGRTSCLWRLSGGWEVLLQKR